MIATVRSQSVRCLCSRVFGYFVYRVVTISAVEYLVTLYIVL
jgi:hypothetical protein